MPPGAQPPSRAKMKRIFTLLQTAYGPRECLCRGKGVDVLIDTILSQNTSDANSTAGFKRLRRRFRSWNQVADAPVEEVERCIRISGLSRIKAPRIQEILKQIKADRGKTDLQFLAEIDEKSAHEYLIRFKGVGPKTAACTLLFAFGKAVFPVDTHIHRIARRLELISPKTTAEQAQSELTNAIDKPDRYPMHVLLITHGRKTCRAIGPKCDQCVLLRMCPFGKLRMATGEISADQNNSSHHSVPARASGMARQAP